MSQGSTAPQPKNHSSIYQAIFPGTCQKLAFTGTATLSSVFAAGVSIVKLFSTQDCWVRFGGAPTAAANDGSSAFVPGGMNAYFGVTPSQRLSVIRDTTSGDIHITQGSTDDA